MTLKIGVFVCEACVVQLYSLCISLSSTHRRLGKRLRKRIDLCASLLPLLPVELYG